MALINCQECNREISDTVRACPHCGYSLVQDDMENKETQKVELTSVNIQFKNIQENKEKIKKILAGVVVLIIIIFSVIIGMKIWNEKQYIANVYELKENIQLAAVTAEDVVDLTGQVWIDSIYRDYNVETAKYTIKKKHYSSGVKYYFDEEYEEDFNEALTKLFEDPSIQEKINSINYSSQYINEISLKLQNPPQKYERLYDTVTELMDAYISLTYMATDPSGNYQSFIDNTNISKTDIIENYKKLDMLLG